MESRSIYIATSPALIIIISIFYGAMSIALWLSSLTWWVASVGCLALALHYRLFVSLHGLRTHKNSVGILRQDCDKWQYQLKSGQNCLGTLIKHKSYCSRLVLILYIQHLATSRYIVIPRDALSERNYRLLAYKLHC